MRSKTIKKLVAAAMIAALGVTSIGNVPEAQAAVKAKKLTVKKKKVTLYAGAEKAYSQVKLKVTVKPKKAKVTYKTNKKKVATVSKKGVVKAKKAGKAKITVKSGKKKVVVKVTVKKVKKITKLTAKDVTLAKKGDSTTFAKYMTVKPAKATLKAAKYFKYKSSNAKIAAVNKKGKITAKADTGSANIKVTAQDGSKKKVTVKVTVASGAAASTSPSAVATKPAASTTPSAIPSRSATATPQATNTAAPAGSDQPGTSDTPATSDQPTTSDTPATSDQPTTSDTPATSDQPGTSDTPATSDQPGTSDTPATSDQPTTSDQPQPTATGTTTPDEPIITGAPYDQPTVAPDAKDIVSTDEEGNVSVGVDAGKAAEVTEGALKGVDIPLDDTTAAALTAVLSAAGFDSEKSQADVLAEYKEAPLNETAGNVTISKDAESNKIEIAVAQSDDSEAKYEVTIDENPWNSDYVNVDVAGSTSGQLGVKKVDGAGKYDVDWFIINDKTYDVKSLTITNNEDGNQTIQFVSSNGTTEEIGFDNEKGTFIISDKFAQKLNISDAE